MPANISVQQLTKVYDLGEIQVRARRGVSVDIQIGEFVAVIGPSGSGKSTVLNVINQTIKINSGTLIVNEEDVTQIKKRYIPYYRREIGMIFQDPMNSLNPVLTVGHQIDEAQRLHLGFGKQQARDRTVELLDRVGIPSAAERANDYPHQLSGGMQQRAMIAMAISCEPQLLIADEPTTALDVTIQLQYLRLLKDIQARTGLGIIFITHDFGVVARMCDRVAVMFEGRIVAVMDIAEATVEKVGLLMAGGGTVAEVP